MHTFQINLDDKIYIALVFIAGDRSVRPDDLTAINSGREVDVLTHRQPQNVVGGGQGKAEPPGVVAHCRLVQQSQQVLLIRVLESDLWPAGSSNQLKHFI